MITVLDCLESTAAKFAANIICSDAKKQITYTDFVKNARAIGSFLCKYEKMRQPVAVFMDNSVEAWEAMLGVVYSGNFYVVIDALMPIERIKNIFTTLRPVAVIVDEKCQKQAAKLGMGQDVYDYEQIVQTSPDADKLQAVREKMIDADPVYALFTSGSTRRAQGNVLTHLSVMKYTQLVMQKLFISMKILFSAARRRFTLACLYPLCFQRFIRELNL